MQVLVIDENPEAASWLSERMKKGGFRVVSASSPEAAGRNDLLEHAAAIIVSPAAAGGDGVELVRQIRDLGLDQPLIVVSAKIDWREKVACLDAGADDFVVRPVRSEEIAARIRAIIRRQSGSVRDVMTLGDIELDLAAHCAWRSGKCLDLTRNEFRLLRLFFLRPTKVLTGEQITQQLYAGGPAPSRNAIEVSIARLRKKVGDDRILTIRNVGYRFNLETLTAPETDPPRENCQAANGGVDA